MARIERLGHVFLVAAIFTAHQAIGAPLTIDLGQSVSEPHAVDLGQGTSNDPAGDVLSADNRSFFINGKPWIPIVGEFHFARYPRDEWRDELLKMKSGGITVVSTYVFWIFHEEQRGQFDWSDRRSLRDFLQLCKEVGLKSIVRMGPWAHGEIRNGGFPDWVENSHTKLRSTDPAFMDLVKPFYEQTAEQMHGLLWKDGGPVIGIQVDNECDGLPYLFELKKLAQSYGVDVPFYTMTGWNGAHIPTRDLLPVFGGYADGFWGGSLEEYRKGFIFTDIRDSGDLGAQFSNKHADRSNNIGLFPYGCCEIGGGMMSSYNRRIQIDPLVTAAMAMVKLGSGNNMPGYYMYQGGTNPDAKLSSVNETHPNAMPLKNYDFEAPLGACGEVRPQFALLREQHLFLEDFGPAMARMPAIFPDTRPADLKDASVLRWSLRSDGNAGFLFINNRQPAVPLPNHPDTQFSLHTRTGDQLVPDQPTAIPSGAFCIWPINMDCDGVTLKYATAQPLCRMIDGSNAWYFLVAVDGISPELSFASSAGQTLEPSLTVRDIVPGLKLAAWCRKADGSTINFAVVTADQASHLCRGEFAGRDRLMFSNAVVLMDKGGLRLQANRPGDLTVSFFPPVPVVRIGDSGIKDAPGEIFQGYVSPNSMSAADWNIDTHLEHPATDANTDLQGSKEAAWDTAAEWSLQIPPELAHHHVILQIHYMADAARIYCNDQLINDDYFHGDPLDLALWRIPQKDWPSLRIKTMPLSDKLLPRLPSSVRAECESPAGLQARNHLTIKTIEQFELQVDAR